MSQPSAEGKGHRQHEPSMRGKEDGGGLRSRASTALGRLLKSQLFVHVCQFPHTQHSHLMLYKSFKVYTKDYMSLYHLKYHVIAYFIKFDRIK
jgi:hypothetical protein